MQETESVLDVGSRRPCVHFAGGEGRLSEFVHGGHSGETCAPANPGLRTAPRTGTTEDERAHRRIYPCWFPPVGRAQGAVSELCCNLSTKLFTSTITGRIGQLVSSGHPNSASPCVLKP